MGVDGVTEIGGEEGVKGEGLVDVVLSECEGEYGPRTSSPDNRGECLSKCGQMLTVWALLSCKINNTLISSKIASQIFYSPPP